MKDILSKISPNEALEIVRRLAKSNKELRKRIEKLAEDIIRDVDVEEICDDVFFVLDGSDSVL